MRKMTGVFLLVFVYFFIITVYKVEGEDDYNYLLGRWEVQWEGPLLKWELIVKEVFPIENKAMIILQHPDLKLGGGIVKSQTLDIDYAIFKPGETSEIVYKAPSGNEYFFKLKENGKGMSKLLRVGGGPNSIWYGEVNKK
jgi:hypothetical protein